MISADLLIGVLAGLAAVAFAAVFLWRLRRHRPPAVIALDALRTDYLRAGLTPRVSWLGGIIVTGTLAGNQFKLVVHDRENRTLTLLTLMGAASSPFKVSYEGSRTLAGRDLLGETFADPKARDAARALFAMGFGNLQRGRGGASALQWARAEVPPLPKLEEWVGHLALIRDAPPPVP